MKSHTSFLLATMNVFLTWKGKGAKNWEGWGKVRTSWRRSPRMPRLDAEHVSQAQVIV